MTTHTREKLNEIIDRQRARADAQLDAVPTARMTRQPTTQFTARLPAELHTWLAERAQKNHRSANAELAAILERLRVMESPIHVCTGCRAPSAYAMSNPDGLCRKCEFRREHGQGN